MQTFLDLYTQNRASQSPYSPGSYVSLPYCIKDSKDALTEVAGVLQKDGFTCVAPWAGCNALYVNLTLHRFGYIPKACSSSCFNNDPLNASQFLSGLYRRYKTEPAFRANEEYNYAKSAVYCLKAAFHAIGINEGRVSDPRFIRFEIEELQALLQQLSKTLPLALQSLEILLNNQSQPLKEE